MQAFPKIGIAVVALTFDHAALTPPPREGRYSRRCVVPPHIPFLPGIAIPVTLTRHFTGNGELLLTLVVRKDVAKFLHGCMLPTLSDLSQVILMRMRLQTAQRATFLQSLVTLLVFWLIITVSHARSA